MERVRRSIFKVVSKKSREEDDNQAGLNYDVSWPHGMNWSSDAEAITNGILFFRVKFYGTAQLCTSHGRRVCEETLLEIKSEGNKIKALLFVSPRSLRLADEKTRSLIFDIEISKLMFSSDATSVVEGFTFVTKEGDQFYRCYAFAARDNSGFRVASAIAGSYCIGWNSHDDNNNNLIELSSSKRSVPPKPPRDYTWMPSEEIKSEVKKTPVENLSPEDPCVAFPTSAKKPQSPVKAKGNSAARLSFRQSSLRAFPKIPSLKALRRQTSLNPEILGNSGASKKKNFEWILTDCNTGKVACNPVVNDVDSSEASKKRNILDSSLVYIEKLPVPVNLTSQAKNGTNGPINDESATNLPGNSKNTTVFKSTSDKATTHLPVEPPPRPPRPPRLERQAPVLDTLCLPQTVGRPTTPLSPTNPFFDNKFGAETIESDPWVPLDNSSTNKGQKEKAELSEKSQFSDLFDDFNPSVSFDFGEFKIDSVLANPKEQLANTNPRPLNPLLLSDPFGEEWSSKTRTEISISLDSNNPFNES